MPYVDRQNRVCGFLDIEEKEGSNRFQRRYFILDTQGNTLLWYMDNPQVHTNTHIILPVQTHMISDVEATGKQKPKTEFCFVINAVSRRYFLQANDAADLRDWVIALNKATKITVSTPTHVASNQLLHSRKSWKRRFFMLDNNSVSYYKCETEPLRAVLLRDIQKVHECLVKSGDLLMRDNLFEIITSSRVFYIQVSTDTPEDMQGWIRDIEGKIQDFRGPGKVKVDLNSTYSSDQYY
uniref:Pleckstrin homology domain containing A2 n=1 Tax=Oncorhynchus kisutch TaxID=8019 RepID=A0A8C7LBB1_ONCKI